MTPIRYPADRRRGSLGGSVTAALARAPTRSFRLEPSNPKLNRPKVNPIYSITMPDRRHPQFEQDWRDSVWAVVVLLGILFLRYLTGR